MNTGYQEKDFQISQQSTIDQVILHVTQYSVATLRTKFRYGSDANGTVVQGIMHSSGRLNRDACKSWHSVW